MALALDCLLLAIGTFSLAALVRRLGLPPLLGMIVAGVTLGFLDLPSGLPGPRLEGFSSELRLGVLVVVLLRAGLGISGSDLRSAGPLGLRLATIPLLGDIALVVVGSMVLFGLGFDEALVLGALVAAISPAIVIPGLLSLLRRGQGEADRADEADETDRNQRRERVLKSLLVGAPLDNIFALVVMGVALDAATQGSGSLISSMASLFWSVGVGLGAGAVVGLLLGLGVRRLGERGCGWWALIGILICGGGLVVSGQIYGFSFVLSLITLGAVVRAMAPVAREGLDVRLLKIWGVAQYALFGLIGTAVDIGPLASVGIAVVFVVLLGQAGRAMGSILATSGSGLVFRERLACVFAYVPKATIQAAFAALPLDRGLGSGGLILTTAVFAVVITAPLGVITLRRGVDRLLVPSGPKTPDPGRPV